MRKEVQRQPFFPTSPFDSYTMEAQTGKRNSFSSNAFTLTTITAPYSPDSRLLFSLLFLLDLFFLPCLLVLLVPLVPFPFFSASLFPLVPYSRYALLEAFTHLIFYHRSFRSSLSLLVSLSMCRPLFHFFRLVLLHRCLPFVHFTPSLFISFRFSYSLLELELELPFKGSLSVCCVAKSKKKWSLFTGLGLIVGHEVSLEWDAMKGSALFWSDNFLSFLSTSFIISIVSVNVSECILHFFFLTRPSCLQSLSIFPDLALWWSTLSSGLFRILDISQFVDKWWWL